MNTDNTYCEKYCKGYRDTGGKCFVDGRCNAYLEHQKQKDLLLKDLCARIRYGVKVILPEIRKDIATLVGISDTCYIVAYDNSIINCPFEIEIKPYLRPMSSMTEEEYNEFKAFHCLYGWHPEFYAQMCNLPNITNMINWLKSHHFDYQGLIPMGLALEAPEDMYEV